MRTVYDKTQRKCRGKWKTHGELITDVDINNITNIKIIQKICKRCFRYVYWEIIHLNDR